MHDGSDDSRNSPGLLLSLQDRIDGTASQESESAELKGESVSAKAVGRLKIAISGLSLFSESIMSFRIDLKGMSEAR